MNTEHVPRTVLFFIAAGSDFFSSFKESVRDRLISRIKGNNEDDTEDDFGLRAREYAVGPPLLGHFGVKLGVNNVERRKVISGRERKEHGVERV